MQAAEERKEFSFELVRCKSGTRLGNLEGDASQLVRDDPGPCRRRSGFEEGNRELGFNGVFEHWGLRWLSSEMMMVSAASMRLLWWVAEVGGRSAGTGDDLPSSLMWWVASAWFFFSDHFQRRGDLEDRRRRKILMSTQISMVRGFSVVLGRCQWDAGDSGCSLSTRSS